ncbi:hypothetical protein HY498_05110 [Candidatus Woesearchaeota archaeon]|nr:hypothetical protein [Candidatus Woesearchaeota archaeon]
MSYPLFKKRKDAIDFWREPLKKVWIPKSRGFLQARTSGYYYVPKSTTTPFSKSK